MRLRHLIIITLMTGLISMAGDCLSGQWSAALRPGSSARGSAVTASTSIAKTGGEFARPARSFRCRPVPSIHRPRGRRIAAAPVPPRVAAPAPEIVVEVEAVPAEPEAGGPAPPEKKPARKSSASYGKVPPYFIRNDGQIDQAVRYYVKGPRGTVYLTDTEVVFDFLRENPSEEGEAEESGEEPGRPGPEREEKKTFTRLVFRQQFKDSNPEVKVDGRRELPGKINYFIGDKSNWHSNIPTVEEVFYHDLYPGIDLNCFFEGANIRYRYTVRPGADPGSLVFRHVGVDGLELKPSGELIVLTPFGGFVTPAPRITQEIGGEEKEIDGEFTILDDTTVTYRIGTYDKQHPLIIK